MDSFYCEYCFADTEEDCYCDRIVGYYPGMNMDIPILVITEEEWNEYISKSEEKNLEF